MAGHEPVRSASVAVLAPARSQDVFLLGFSVLESVESLRNTALFLWKLALSVASCAALFHYRRAWRNSVGVIPVSCRNVAENELVCMKPSA
jgi:hypothetical protein